MNFEHHSYFYFYIVLTFITTAGVTQIVQVLLNDFMSNVEKIICPV